MMSSVFPSPLNFQQGSISDDVQIAVVLGVAPCLNTPCPMPGEDGVGTILLRSLFDPEDDPSTPEFHILSRVKDYDNCVNLIAEADHLSHGNLLVNETTDEASSSQAGSSSHAAGPSSPPSAVTPDVQQKIEEGKHIFVCQQHGSDRLSSTT